MVILKNLKLILVVPVLILAALINKVHSEENDLKFNEIVKKTVYKEELYDKEGFSKDSMFKHEKTQTIYDPRGYDFYGYNVLGFDKYGYNVEGYDEAGYNQEGYDRLGFNQKGYDRNGFNNQGVNEYGVNRFGDKINLVALKNNKKKLKKHHRVSYNQNVIDLIKGNQK